MSDRTWFYAVKGGKMAKMAIKVEVVGDGGVGSTHPASNTRAPLANQAANEN